MYSVLFSTMQLFVFVILECDFSLLYAGYGLRLHVYKLDVCCLAAGPSSRPHSSTSAEVEQGLATLSLSSPAAAATPGPPSTMQQVTSTRIKEASRYIYLLTKYLSCLLPESVDSILLITVCHWIQL